MSVQKSTPLLPLQNKFIFNSEFQERKWFHQQGKSSRLALQDEVMVKLRLYFNSLDENNDASIGSSQLEDPLIAFGLCQDRQGVEALVKCKQCVPSEIDTDSSGVIEFDQFVQIFKKVKSRRKGNGKKESDKFAQFAKIISGDLQSQMSSVLSFRTSISEYRRKMILNFLKKKSPKAIMDGRRIAKALAVRNNRADLLSIINKYQ